MQDLSELWKIFKNKYTDTGLIKGAFSAPGRVNLIGEHTDYNDGFVLPMAIEREIIMLGQLRNDHKVIVFDLGYNTEISFSLNKLIPRRKNAWANYLMGVVDEIQKTGYILQGANIIFISNIPQKAGLSSSAALEIVTALTMTELNSLKIEPVKMALLCQQAENNFVGVACGIMDQYVSRLGRKDNVLFIDCRTNNYELIPFRDSNYQIVICDSKIRRDLINSEYNKRREECKKATEFFTYRFGNKVQALRDVTIEEFKQYQEYLPETIARRARHVILENYRVQASKKAIEAGDYITFGQLMIESHQSLKVDYEVSCGELDLLVDLALKQEGVLGARMTGAGFGGCTVNLLKREKVNIFKKTIQKEYKRITGIIPDTYITIPADGAKVLKF
jgi:galactokinase